MRLAKCSRPYSERFGAECAPSSDEQHSNDMPAYPVGVSIRSFAWRGYSCGSPAKQYPANGPSVRSPAITRRSRMPRPISTSASDRNWIVFPVYGRLATTVVSRDAQEPLPVAERIPGPHSEEAMASILRGGISRVLRSDAKQTPGTLRFRNRPRLRSGPRTLRPGRCCAIHTWIRSAFIGWAPFHTRSRCVSM